MSNVQLLFLAGIPATGKSYFGGWLEATHGFVHIDAEVPGQFARFGLHALWDQSLLSTDASAFAVAIQCRHSKVVLNWGFPV